MYKYMLKESQTDLIDCSTPEERDYINGDTTFNLIGWTCVPKGKYFEKSEASIMLSALPVRIQAEYKAFTEDLIEYIVTLNDYD